jgi:AbrB family looped-hinge helix DNA binding protein
MPEATKIGKKFQLVIPKSIREKVKIAEGDQVFIDVINGSIVITTVPKSIKELSGIGRGLYTDHHVSDLRDEWE